MSRVPLIVRSSFTSFSTLLRQNTVGVIPHSRGYETLNFAQMTDEVVAKKCIVLDVRERAEIIDDGLIPGGKNLPIGEVQEALNLNDTAFSRKYGFKKPKLDDDLVIHCKAGVRAQLVAKAMEQLGFSNIRVYSGINDWKEKGGKLVKS